MRRLFITIALLTLLALVIALPAMADEATDAATDIATASATDAVPMEWTVLIYMCGSDMETNSGMATYNLHEIMGCYQPEFSALLGESGQLIHEALPPRVNVVVETGGALEWQNVPEEEDFWGLQVANDKLQRYVLSHEKNDFDIYALELAEELPMASMADPETLTDFIRWGVERCPAQRYMLVLWGHGNGASTGMLIDEAYDDDILYLYELDEALAQAGVHFDVALLDACLMSNLETACVMANHADWMVASEDLAPGYGTAFKDWLNVLFLNPDCDGGQLGCTICDVTDEKYSAMEDNSNLAITWTVIELSLVDEVAEAFNNLYAYIDLVYENDPDRLQGCLAKLFTSDKLGTGEECMYDLGEPLKNSEIEVYIDLELRNALINALYDAVLYTVNGVDRAGNDGLSYCYPITLPPERLEIYARNFKKCPAYLAFLDAAVSDWEAPDWVYEHTERLTPSEQIARFRGMPEMSIENGLPVVIYRWSDGYIWRGYYELFREDADTGELQRLGIDLASVEYLDDYGLKLSMDGLETWPAIDGVLCSIDYRNMVIQSDYYTTGARIYFYNVPIQVGPDQMNLSVGVSWKYDLQRDKSQVEYRIYGTTQGFDEERCAPNRSAKPLLRLQGQEFELLYQLDAEDDSRTSYGYSEPLTMYRGLEVEEIPLPEGIYYCDYIVENCLMQNFRCEKVKLYWDGSAFTVLGVLTAEDGD